MSDRKRCGECKRRRFVKFFNKKRASSDRLQSLCKDCNRERSRRYYQRNRSAHIARCVAYKRERRIGVSERVRQYLLEHPCIDCEEGDPIVLEFDHVRGKKFMAIGMMINRSFSWRRIRTEIRKCEVRCANCHRRRTAVNQGWHTFLMKAAA